jgi:HlyD family secretion protein
MNLWIKRALWTVSGLGLVASIGWSYVPKPVAVETEALGRGPLRVEVEADGQTRVKRRYLVSAPVSGVISRPEQRAGDPVKAGEALVTLAPIEPPLLDARTHAQADAQVKVATAARAQAEAQVDLAKTSVSFARTELDRERKLAETGTTSPASLEAAELKLRTAEQQLAAARIGVQGARFQEEAAAATVLRATGRGGDARVALRSPTDGKVLRVLVQDGGVVAAGTPILEGADPGELEVVVDLLTTDAVNVRPGAAVSVLRWGGPSALSAAVRNVEPAGYTKVSALGVEEQRVHVIADFTGDHAARAALGDGYRVEARVVVADLPDVLRAPLAALFRSGEDWALFTVKGGRAQLARVRLGQRNERFAEVLSGVELGAAVVLRPGDRLKDGVKVTPRLADRVTEPLRVATE